MSTHERVDNPTCLTMPDQPNLTPTFHEGCYCFRDAEAEAARASGQPVRCGGGQPCACVDAAPPYDAMWDNILGDVLQPQPRGGKRPRSQCASCSCACAILHAAYAAATAAAAKIRRCCGGDCRCPPGLCRCPQEAVPVDTYACGALNESISQRVASALQMEPPLTPDVSAALQALQPQSALSSADIANALNASLQGLPGFTNAQQNLPVQTTRTACCGLSDLRPQRQQLPPDDLTTSMPLITTPPRSCCGNASSKAPLTNGEISATAGMTTTEIETAIDGLTAVTPSRPSGGCGGASSAPVVQPTSYSEVVTTGDANGESSRHSAISAPTRTTPSGSTRVRSFPGSTPSSKSEPTQRSGDRDRIFACHLCDAAFKFKQNRDRHINEVHRGLRPHECDYPGCPSAFKNLSGLKQHKKTVHEKARPFKCELCDRAFGQRNHLSQHVLVVHDKVKRYPCNFCDMAFSNVGNRTQHTKRRHPNEIRRKENEPRQLKESTA